MLRKILSLCLVAVMLSTAAFASEFVELTAVYAAEEAEAEVTTSSFEAIYVKEAADGTLTLTSGYGPGSSSVKMQGEYGTTGTANNWIYFKYDISSFKGMNADEIQSVVLGTSLKNNKTGTFYIKSLKKSVYDEAIKTITAEDETATTITVDATTAAAKFVDPRLDTDTDLELLGSVYKAYKATNSAKHVIPAKLTGITYTFNTLSKSVYQTATINGGAVDEYVKEAIKNGDDSLYFSLYFYNSGSKNDSYGNAYFGTASNYITVSTEPMVIYNSVAGNKFDTDVTELASATDFTYSAIVASKDTNVRLLAAIYGENETLLDVVASDVFSSNDGNEEGNLELTVPLSSYTDATSVKCFIWDGTTLRPYAEPKVTPVAVATAAE